MECWTSTCILRILNIEPHFLFVKVSEALSRMTEGPASIFALWFLLFQSAHVASYLQSANDTLVFCDAHRVSMMDIKVVTRHFKALPRPWINFSKRDLISVRLDRGCWVSCHLPDIKECKTWEIPSSSLGIPLYRSSLKGSVGPPSAKNWKKALYREVQLTIRCVKLTMIKVALSAFPFITCHLSGATLFSWRKLRNCNMIYFLTDNR